MGANPHLRGVPMAVAQYNPFGDTKTMRPSDDRAVGPTHQGSLIAVSYEARAAGVKRFMRGSEAAKCCPELK